MSADAVYLLPVGQGHAVTVAAGGPSRALLPAEEQMIVRLVASRPQLDGREFKAPVVYHMNYSHHQDAVALPTIGPGLTNLQWSKIFDQLPNCDCCINANTAWLTWDGTQSFQLSFHHLSALARRRLPGLDGKRLLENISSKRLARCGDWNAGYPLPHSHTAAIAGGKAKSAAAAAAQLEDSRRQERN